MIKRFLDWIFGKREDRQVFSLILLRPGVLEMTKEDIIKLCWATDVVWVVPDFPILLGDEDITDEFLTPKYDGTRQPTDEETLVILEKAGDFLSENFEGQWPN